MDLSAAACRCITEWLFVAPNLLYMATNVIGFLGCNLAAFSNVWNAFHCCVEGSSILNDSLAPLFNLLSGDK